MNNTSQCIFDISHVLRNLRDTMEFTINKEHEVKAYDQRKQILQSILDPKSFLGKFIEDNSEKLADFKKKYEEFLDEVYGEKSTILVKNGESLRIDHAQNIKIFDYVIYLSETLRDVLYSHVAFSKQKQMNEVLVTDLVDADERFDRVLKTFLVMQEYNKSFMEFQKVMSESKGQPTPQSNYIVQNELNKFAGMVRFNRAHCHFTDNPTLDLLDKSMQLLEMCEGRRDRRDNKSFPDLFKETLEPLAAKVNELAPKYQALYETALKEMLATIKSNAENNKDTAKA